MKRHSRLLTRSWMLAGIVIVIVAGHAVLPYVLSHVGVSSAIVSGVVILIVIKHLGVAGAAIASLTALLRRQSRP